MLCESCRVLVNYILARHLSPYSTNCEKETSSPSLSKSSSAVVGGITGDGAKQQSTPPAINVVHTKVATNIGQRQENVGVDAGGR